MIRLISRWLQTFPSRAYSRYRRRHCCVYGEHRIALAWPFGTMRWVCLDCPHAEPIGRVSVGASNHSHYSP